MGGDDLGDGDLIFLNQDTIGDDGDSSVADDGSTNSHDDNNNDDNVEKKKRKLDTTISDTSTTKKKKKKKTNLSSEQLLIQSGRNIEEQDLIEQAQFLTTAIKHYSLIEEKSGVNSNNDDVKIITQYLLDVREKSSSYVDTIRDVVSVKKMKQWKIIGSPCVLIVCISARRAVEILKEIAPLKVRAAKLFPKNNPLDKQKEMLLTTKIGLAVGTPQRLRQLVECNNNALSLKKTKLIILDCSMSNKQFTVCTLPDTAPHTMALIRDSILPQLKARSKDCKLVLL